MIYVNRTTSADKTRSDKDVYVESDCSVVMWQWNGDEERFDQVQVTSRSDVDRLIEALQKKAAEAFGGEP